MRLGLAAGVRLVDDHLSGRPLLLAPERGLFLNATAAAVVGLLPASLESIVGVLAARAGLAPEALRPDVERFIAALRARGLVTQGGTASGSAGVG